MVHFSLIQYTFKGICPGLDLVLGAGFPTVQNSSYTVVSNLINNMLSRLVINFLPRSKHLLISWHSLNSLDIAFITKLWIFSLFACGLWKYRLPLKTSGQEPLMPSSAITIQA